MSRARAGLGSSIMPERNSAISLQIGAGCCSTQIVETLLEYERVCVASARHAIAVHAWQRQLFLRFRTLAAEYEMLKHRFQSAYAGLELYHEPLAVFNRQSRAIAAWEMELLVHLGECATWPSIFCQLESCFSRVNRPLRGGGIPLPRSFPLGGYVH